jgi:predicted DNA-binding protein YlxM (UPF0122 family)
MENFVYLNNLYDIYKELLTQKQQDYFKDYYQNDLTLSEIAENNDVSRNAVHKQLKETIKNLENYEEKLKILEKKEKILDLIKEEKLKNKIERIIEG